MDTKNFYTAILFLIETKYGSDISKIPLGIQNFLTQFKSIFFDKDIDDSIKITSMTIIFEALYRSKFLDSNFKNDLRQIRNQRWSSHFGIPTVFFLLSYAKQIEQISNQFDLHIEGGAVDYFMISNRKIEIDAKLDFDKENQIIVDNNVVKKISMPEHKETMGLFIKTHNPSGGFTTTASDPYSQKFLEHASLVGKKGGKILEIGAAFGVATLEALARGAIVFCNDIDPQNLAVVHNRFFAELLTSKDEKSFTNDNGKLVLLPGDFPDELQNLPNESFDAILISRVLHFFPGEKIERAMKLINSLLKPEGKVFIVCETPFLKNWEKFIPEFEKRLAKGVEWPGEITTPSEFESSGRAASLPKFVHWLTKEVLEKSLIKSDLKIECSAYINRKGQFPNDLLLNGKESVGAIGVKKMGSKI